MEDEEATELATIQLRIADIQDLLNAQNPDRPADSYVALEVYLEELQREVVILQDRQVSKSWVHFQETEELEKSDDEDNEPDPEEEVFTRFTELNVAAPIDAQDPNNDIVNKPSHPFARTGKTCALCLDENLVLMRVVTAPCCHIFCEGCVRELFDKCLRDETMFPPRCCECEEPIPPEKVSLLIGEETLRRYQEKKIEFATPQLKRVYCSKGECAAFIPVENVNPVEEEAHCGKCGAVTCTICKGLAHDGECPDDPVLIKLLEMAKKEGWKRCRKCHAVISLNRGCFHMSCLCGHEFCWTCSAEWKTCQCKQWDERLIIDEDDEDIARHVGCDREQRWARIDGRGVCHVYWEVMTGFVLECEQCGLRACHRCRYHRA